MYFFSYFRRGRARIRQREDEETSPESSRSSAVPSPSSYTTKELSTPYHREKERANELSRRLAVDQPDQPPTASDRAKERADELSRKLVAEGKYHTKWQTVSDGLC